MDTITTTATSSTSTGTTSTSTSASGLIGEITHGLRHILDGGVSAVKGVRGAAKTATAAYAHGGGIGALASQVVDKLG